MKPAVLTGNPLPALCLLIGAVVLLAPPPAFADAEAERNYQRFLAIYRQENPSRSDLLEAHAFLETANRLAPDTYKVLFSLGAVNNTLARYEAAATWLEKAGDLASTEERRRHIQAELEYCRVQLAKARVETWGGPGVSISFIMKSGTVEMDPAAIESLPRRLPPIAAGASPEPLVAALRRALKGMELAVAPGDPFVVFSLEDEVSPEDHYEKGIKDFYRYFMHHYFDQPPRHRIPVLISSRPHILVEATRRLYAGAGLPVYAPFLGYYNPADRLIAATGGRAGYGTLLHEMVHALVASDFPGAPPWLDEGLASLYERTRWAHDRLVALPNWRMDAMREADVPSLADLVRRVESVGMHSREIADVRLLLLCLDQRRQAGDLYRRARRQGAAFSLGPALAELGLEEAQWRSFVRDVFRDYRAEIARSRGALSNPDEVRFLQLALNAVLGAGLEPDGIWGPATKAKLIAFQRSRGLQPDGIPGTRTLAALKRRYALDRVGGLAE